MNRMRLLWAAGFALSMAGACGSAKRTMVLFPLDVGSDITVPSGVEISSEATNAVYSRLTKLATISTSRFNKRNPSLLRAVMEDPSKKARLEPPYNEEDGPVRRSVYLTREMGADLAASGSVAAFSYNADTREASVTLTLDVIGAEEGKVVVSGGVTGRARGAEGETAATVVYRALGEAADSLFNQIKANLGGEKTEVPADTNKSKPKSGDKGKRRQVSGSGLFGAFAAAVLFGLLARQ